MLKKKVIAGTVYNITTNLMRKGMSGTDSIHLSKTIAITAQTSKIVIINMTTSKG